MTLHILHLEDTKPLRDILAATLNAIHPNCELHQFIDGDGAAEYVKAHCEEIDLYLLDVRVPGSLDGLGVAELIRQMECRGAVVMTSAYMSPARERLNTLNAHWFQKPWQIEDVQEMLRLATTASRTTS